MKKASKAKRRGPFFIDSCKTAYKNPWMLVKEFRVHRESGKKGLFGILTMHDGAAVVALDDQKRVFLTKEFRFAINHISYELPGGGIEAGETPLSAAKKELAEEAGLKAKKWTHLGHIDPFTAIVKSRNYMFLAQGLKKTSTKSDSWIEVEYIRVPLSEAIDMITKGKITHGASCVALLLAARKLGV
jgi:8-oxo-dGTP pyrophosphatase MutT (NUDIX family)